MVCRFVFCLLTTLVIGISAHWRDPESSPALQVSHNASELLRVGDVVELTCTSQRMVVTSTLHWTRAQGNVQIALSPRGRSPLVQLVRVTRDLHGAEFFCSGPRMEQQHKSTKTYMYTIRSERVRLAVEGGTDAVIPTKPGTIEMTSSPAATEHHVGDVVDFTCTARGLATTVVDVILAKGNAEMQLHTGWQPQRRMSLRLTAAEHGARMYCVVTTLEEDLYTLYALVSNAIPISIH